MKERLAAILLLSVSQLVPAHAAPSKPFYEGEGAQRLVGQAVKISKSQGRPGLCLAGVDVMVNVRDPVASPVSSPMTMLYNSFTFNFMVPGRNGTEAGTAMDEWVSGAHGGPHYVATGSWSGLSHQAMGYIGEYPLAECITDMTIDSGKALSLAVRKGLRISSLGQKSMRLRTNPAGGSRFYPQRELPGKTFWMVKSDQGGLEYFIDAGSGELLLTRKR